MLLRIILGAACAAAIAGLAIQAIADRVAAHASITRREFLVGTLLIACLVAPVGGYGAYHLAKQDRATYHEMWNGYEVAADVAAVTCSRDGPCRWEYDCDPYTVQVPYQDCHTTGVGKDARTTCTTQYRTETRYHSCPYVTAEYHYTVESTVGDMTIDTHRFPDAPDAHRWRASKPVPAGVAQQAGVGAPPLWTAARARLAAHAPGPVTAVRRYENYILASERTLLTQWSGEVARLDSAKMLPSIQAGVYDVYQADKARFVRWRTRTPRAWQQQLAHFNAALGHTLRGDLRLVIVGDQARTLNPDQYLFALKAYWQDSERFGRDALPKNAILVVLGTHDDSTVAWARASTGMPLGNEALETAVRTQLPGRPLVPDSILGPPAGVLATGVTVRHATGALEQIVFGLTTPESRFQRVSMVGGQAGDVGTGFLYLKGEIRPSTRGAVLAWLGTTLLSCLVWGLMLAIGPPRWHAATRASLHWVRR